MSRRTWYRKHRWNQASFDFGTEATQLMPPGAAFWILQGLARKNGNPARGRPFQSGENARRPLWPAPEVGEALTTEHRPPGEAGAPQQIARRRGATEVCQVPQADTRRKPMQPAAPILTAGPTREPPPAAILARCLRAALEIPPQDHKRNWPTG